MARGKNHRPVEREFAARLQIDGLNSGNRVVADYESRHLGAEVHFATTLKNRVAHVFYHPRQLVSAYVRMGIGKYRRRSAVLAEHVEYLLRVAALLRACIQLTVRVGSCPTFTETVVALLVHLLGLGDKRQVQFALTHVLATLQHHRA